MITNIGFSYFPCVCLVPEERSQKRACVQEGIHGPNFPNIFQGRCGKFSADWRIFAKMLRWGIFANKPATLLNLATGRVFYCGNNICDK